ncbi:MAG TPA: HD domain-containing protein [Solirubrobacteraceae bacterium]
MPSSSPIATLRAGEALDGVFACVRKERGISRSGSPYLTLELRDSTGSVLGRAFRDADLLSGRFESGDIVHVKGRVERFKDALQVEVREVERVEVSGEELAGFLPASRRDLNELEGFLEHLVREIYDDGLRGLCERLLGNKAVREELRRAPCGLPGEPGSRGGAGRHHAYLGGLLEHTVAVATLALELCEVHPRLDRDLLLCAAIVHDIGRTREFSYGSEISRTEEGRLLGHVELGLRLIAGNAPSSLSRERLLSLEHCVAMHHGADGGGELRFGSSEAVALYRVNALDATVKGALERAPRVT